MATPIVTLPERHASREGRRVAARIDDASRPVAGVEVGPELASTSMNCVGLADRQARIVHFQQPLGFTRPEFVEAGEAVPGGWGRQEGLRRGCGS